MFQVKNDATHSNSPQLNLFHAMDPCSLGILGSPANVHIIVIRIVFALGAKIPSLTLVDYDASTTKKGCSSLARMESTCATERSYTRTIFGFLACPQRSWFQLRMNRVLETATCRRLIPGKGSTLVA